MSKIVERACVGLIAALLGGAPLAFGQALDPTVSQRLVVGKPLGYAPFFRMDSSRTGRSKSRLPRKPRVLWRTRLTGGVDFPLVVDEFGSALTASASGQLVEFGANGKLRWSLRLGGAAIVTGPVITSHALRVVLTATGELISIDRSGIVRDRRQLPAPLVRSASAPLPLEDGGLALALGGQLFRLEAHGTIRAQARVNDEVRSILRGKRGLLIVTELGDVHEWLPPAEPSKLGSFGGRVSEGAALSDAVRLSAVVDHVRLVDFKLSTATRHVRMPESTLLLQGPPAITSNSETRVMSFDGVVLGHDVAGRETLRVSLRTAPALGDGGTPLSDVGSGSPPVLVDAQAWTAIFAAGLDSGVVSPLGELYSTPDTACTDPISLVPAGEGKMLIACRSGSMWLVGD